MSTHPRQAGSVCKASNAADAGCRRPGWLRLGMLLVFLAPVFGVGCTASATGPVAKKMVEVEVVSPVSDLVTDYQDFTGRLDALKTATLTARVSGYIDSAPFKEGDHINAGDVLFVIDPRPYQADFNQAQANLQLAEADSRLQNKNVARAEKLIGTRTISQEDYDTAVATWEKSKATIQASAATRDKAKLYLEYTSVIAPWTGRISRRNVDPGNLVNADNTQLTTIVTEGQIYAYFDVDERTYLDLVKVGSSSEGSWAAKKQYPVLMALANEESFTRAGQVNFVDNRVVATSGTVRMRGIFDNPGENLKAGMFVRIRLPSTIPTKRCWFLMKPSRTTRGKNTSLSLMKRTKWCIGPSRWARLCRGPSRPCG